MSRPPISRFRRTNARRLRADETEAEKRLWKGMRRMPMLGSHFRRQVPIGPYVADFVCMAARLVVEVDGSQHADEVHEIHDRERTRWLESEGFEVLRFWNADIADNLDAVLDVLYAKVHGASDASPLPLRHTRSRRRSAAGAVTPPRREERADPPPPGEGGKS